MTELEKAINGLQLLRKYEGIGLMIEGRIDPIIVGPFYKATITEEDLSKLKELSWSSSEDYEGCWRFFT